LSLQRQILERLSNTPRTAEEIASAINQPGSVETVYLVLEHLAANRRVSMTAADDPAQTTFCQAE
jgi:glucose-6-phosphate isomerase